MRRLRPVIIGAHPQFYNKMEMIRKQFQEREGIRLSQMQLTDLMARKINVNSINLFGGRNAKKKR